MSYAIWMYLIYLAASLTATVYVGRTLYRHGRVFLIDAMRGNVLLADSVNRLLLVGFYLINLGYVTVALRYGTKPASAVEGIETFSTKIGVVLLVLGAMHFFNVFVLSRVRRRGQRTESGWIDVADPVEKFGNNEPLELA